MCLCAGVLVSGSRDGTIMVWDTRCTGKGSSQKPVNTIHSAHERAGLGRATKPSGTKASAASVTAVLFHGDNKIASCGASDGYEYTAHTKLQCESFESHFQFLFEALWYHECGC